MRRYSKEWRFFCSGKSASQSPLTVSSSAFSSKGCFMPGVSTSVPLTVSALPSVSLTASLKLGRLSSQTICRFLKWLPSLSSMKANVLLSRSVRTQPLTVICVPWAGVSENRVEMSVVCM